jgi:regulator of replication initiation timing
MDTTKKTINFNPFSINNYQDFYLMQNGIIYKILIEQNKNEIKIKSNNNYIKIAKLNELSTLFKNDFHSLNNAFDYIIKIFEENKVSIKNIIIKKQIILTFKINNKQEIDIILIFNKQSKSKGFILDELNKLNNEIQYLKNENNNLRRELNKLKKYNDNEKPKEIKLVSEISKNSYSDYGLDNTFTIFKSINDLLYLVYSTKKSQLFSRI